MYEELKDQVREFPDKAGVYIMKDSGGKPIYIGKAKSLKKRVGSYFISGKDVKTRVLVNRIAGIEFITTGTEYEALLLENNLIKKWNPRYNINLKDGKSYPVIRVTAEEYPRIFRTRNIVRDGSSYYGPFPSAGKIDIYLELIEKLFPLRKCRGKLKKREHPCLYHHIGRCAAPCAGLITKEEYLGHVEKAKKLLSGRTEELLRDLKKEMKAAAGELQFEKAARLRDTLISIEFLGFEQEVVDFREEARDYAACAVSGRLCTFAVPQMRGGKLLGRDLYRAQAFGGEEEAFTEFFLRYYEGDREPPDIIYAAGGAGSSDSPAGFDGTLIADYFLKERGRRIKIVTPKAGKHDRILRMALENAIEDVGKRARAEANIPGLEELKELFGLSKLPRRIEGFDIAHLSGKNPVASLVSFYNGNPDRKNYRRFHIRSLQGGVDDYEALREAAARRYGRVINEGIALPDLILIDGGKGQVNAVKGVLDALDLDDIPVLGLAKKFEEIYLPGKGKPVRLPDTSEALRILQGVRDETHRFATAFNRHLRQRETGFSVLEEIQGIGKERAARLMKTYRTLDALAAADPEDIARSTSVPLSAARNVVKALEKKDTGDGLNGGDHMTKDMVKMDKIDNKTMKEKIDTENGDK